MISLNRSYDVNQLTHRFSIQFYYPNYRFKVRNIVNRLMGSPAVNRREYLIIQLEDPDNRLPKDNSPNRKFNRASIDAQINKNNPKASCISTKDYPFNEESSNLVTFYLFAPGENLIKTNLKLTAYRKCRQLAPNFATRRFLCAQIGSSEEINVSEQFEMIPKPIDLMPNRFDSISSDLPNASTNTTSIPFTMKLKNFFNLQSTRFQGHYSNRDLLKNDFDDLLGDSLSSISLSKQNRTAYKKSSGEFVDNSNLKELFDGQPVFHKIDQQYTLVGFLVKAPFPSTLAFKHNNLMLLLDLKKFRFQLVTKLIKSLRAYNRT